MFSTLNREKEGKKREEDRAAVYDSNTKLWDTLQPSTLSIRRDESSNYAVLC